jgi:predicted small secreted protein
MKAFAKLTVALVVGAILFIGTLGCNTVKGAGKDIERGGQGVEHAATGAQGK